jgi:hypothetical protein
LDGNSRIVAAFSAVLQDRLKFGLAQSDEPIAYATLTETQQAFPTVTEGLDVLVVSSAPGQAPQGLDWTGDPVFSFTWTSLNVPCVTVPAGVGPGGLPFGAGRTRIGRRSPGRVCVVVWQSASTTTAPIKRLSILQTERAAWTIL